jgi:hypothetical protein
MPKTWDEMSVSEKLDSLRRDVARLLSGYIDLENRLAAGGEHLGRAVNQATQALTEVRELKDQLSKDHEI